MHQEFTWRFVIFTAGMVVFLHIWMSSDQFTFSPAIVWPLKYLNIGFACTSTIVLLVANLADFRFQVKRDWLHGCGCLVMYLFNMDNLAQLISDWVRLHFGII
jgi:hypothetical protein